MRDKHWWVCLWEHGQLFLSTGPGPDRLLSAHNWSRMEVNGGLFLLYMQMWYSQADHVSFQVCKWTLLRARQKTDGVMDKFTELQGCVWDWSQGTYQEVWACPLNAAPSILWITHLTLELFLPKHHSHNLPPNSYEHGRHKQKSHICLLANTTCHWAIFNIIPPVHGIWRVVLILFCTISSWVAMRILWGTFDMVFSITPSPIIAFPLVSFFSQLFGSHVT